MKCLILLSLAGLFVLTSSCGVKGPPRPPQSLVELGRGQPAYEEAGEDIEVDEDIPVPMKKKKEKK